MALRLALCVLDGATDSGVSVALDVFRAANALARRSGALPPFSLAVLSRSAQPITTAAGLRLSVNGGWARLGHSDVALVPGVWMEAPGEVEALLARHDVVDLARRLARFQRGPGPGRRERLVCGSCSGGFVLAAAGLLDGRRATTAWWVAGELRRRFPAVEVDERASLVVDGPVLTAGAVFAMADLALALVSRAAGPRLARQVMKALLLDAHPSQGPYMALRAMLESDASLRRAEDYVQRHLARGVTCDQLARAVGMSPRTLARRFQGALGLSPLGFINRVRLETAARLLETSRLPLDEVAARVGYADPGTLRRLLRRSLDRTPGQLRRTDRPSPPRRARLTG